MPECKCTFVAIGLPLAKNNCEVHDKATYACDCCDCADYRPRKVPDALTKWPRCLCGHIAQDHN